MITDLKDYIKVEQDFDSLHSSDQYRIIGTMCGYLRPEHILKLYDCLLDGQKRAIKKNIRETLKTYKAPKSATVFDVYETE